jgi:mannose-6-phosphate isomerase-like protein (cupin superfamily)
MFEIERTSQAWKPIVGFESPQEAIGAEVHHLDQCFKVEAGSGEAVLDGVVTPIRAGFAVLVPAGTKHNIVNTCAAPLAMAEVGYG